jgi:hypothetical protein
VHKKSKHIAQLLQHWDSSEPCHLQLTGSLPLDLIHSHLNTSEVHTCQLYFSKTHFNTTLLSISMSLSHKRPFLLKFSDYGYYWICGCCLSHLAIFHHHNAITWEYILQTTFMYLSLVTDISSLLGPDKLLSPISWISVLVWNKYSNSITEKLQLCYINH